MCSQVINLISEARPGSLPDMFVMEWSPLMLLPPPGGRASDGHLVVLTDQDINKVSHDSDQVVVSYAGKNFLDGLTADVQRAVSSSRDAAAIVLLRLRPFHGTPTPRRRPHPVFGQCACFCMFVWKRVRSFLSCRTFSGDVHVHVLHSAFH